jgi:hypothetical protein|tara:strand:- start:530 stop:1825 length:1296 start_codon:yes stop_codon:yes gene_type:complete
MWGSLFIGDEYDVPLTFDDEFSNTVIKSLSQHPKFQPKDVPLKSVAVLPSKPQISKGFADNGDGWFESQYGTDANTIIRMCRKMRRHDKMFKSEYDSIIGDIRKVKAMEVDTTIKSLTWSEGMEDVIRNIGLSDRSLKALRKFGESRSTSLQKACQQYLKAITVLQHLNDKLDWNTDDQQNWVDANDMKKDAQKMWRNTLHQVDNLTKHEIQALNYASDILEKEGALGSREIIRRGYGVLNKSMSVNKMSSLLKMYGEEVDVYRGGVRGTFVKQGPSGLIIKDPWAYTAGFVDADGSIFISERGDPRVTIVASGNNGKTHCEELQKMIGCGRLVSDQKLAKNTIKPVHRLIFSSKDDIREVLKGIIPHLKLKSLQAKAVLDYIDQKDSMRKNELYQLVTFNNWKDHKSKSITLLNKWGLDADTVGGFAEGL